MKNTSTSEIVELESILSMTDPISSSVKMPRWQRKQLQSAESNGSDRFIPTPGSIDGESFNFTVKENSSQSSLNAAISANLLDGGPSSEKQRVIAFKKKAPQPEAGYQNHLKVLYTANKAAERQAKPMRHIPSAPLRILDAPDLMDDYYLNLISWSAQNVVAVALQQSVYLWNASSGEIDELMTLDGDDYVSSVSWIQDGGTHLAVGTSSAATQVWDVSAAKQVRNMDGHAARVGSLAWNQHVLSSGSADTTVVNHDVRVRAHKLSVWAAHEQEVCGLKWSPDGSYLASGGNDNMLCLWETGALGRTSRRAYRQMADHQAAVKALAWSPHERHLLASGGGTADRSIKFWNAGTGALLNSIDTGSQVCALQWSPYEKEILSSHGFADNQLSLWKYPSMAKVKDLKGHTSRVLHLCTSPNDGTVLSAAGDETLRFWNVFGANKAKVKAPSGPAVQQSRGLTRAMHIR